MKELKKKVLFFILALFLIFGIVLKKDIMKIPYPQKYSDYVEKYSEKYGIDKNLVYAIIKAESNFNPRAVSKKHAKGLMQLMDNTSEWAAINLGYSKYDIYDPKTNIEMGCWYISQLYKEFGDTDLVVIAYNAGPGNLKKWMMSGRYNKGEDTKKIPFKETKNYVIKIKNNKKAYDNIYIRMGEDEK